MAGNPPGPALRLTPIDLDSEEGGHLARAVRHAHGDALLAAARFAGRLFSLAVSTLPGLCFIGGQASAPWIDGAAPGGRLSFGGTGLSPEAAFAGCIGEGIEHLSQFERPGDLIPDPAPDMPPPVAALLAELGAGTMADRIPGTGASDGTAVSLPAGLCLRRSPERHPWQPPWPLSCGCAAGPDRDAAALRAILELVERDAVALWWIGGRPGRSPDLAAARAAAAVIDQVRQGRGQRIDWVLDITADTGIPTIVALSTDCQGRGLACGFASRLDAAAAARAATLEMAQLELALAVVEAKRREGGDGALAPADRQHVERAGRDTGSWSVMRPAGPAPDHIPMENNCAGLISRLAERGIDLWLADLSRRAYGLPVIRAVAPALQPFPSQRETARLGAARRLHGGGPGAAGITLL